MSSDELEHQNHRPSHLHDEFRGKSLLREKRFSQQGDLQAHLKIHFEETPFVCEICNKSFARKNYLTKHLQIHYKTEFPMGSLREVESIDVTRTSESFLKKYSAEELSVLAKIPRLYRNKRAYRYMQDVIHINPNKVSKSNMNHLIKRQLLEGMVGLSAEEKLQKGQKLLTREESELYDAILKTRWTLKHITFDYDVIKENGNVLKSLQQRMRENNSLDNSHALQETGKDDNVFFTLGSPHHKGAGFLHGQGGHVISLDVNHFSEGGKFKEILSGLQLSDHWYQYLNEGYFSQTYGDTRREVRFYNEASFTLRGHKTYSYYRHDGTVLTRTVLLGQEAVTGAEVLPFIAYNLILELRYIGGRYRRHLLDNLGRRDVIEVAIDSLYHSSNFEVTIPSQINLDSPHITVTPQDANPANTVSNALRMHEAISERQVHPIETLLAAGVPIDILDDKGVTPLIKALSTCRYDIAHFLIESGANLELRYRNYSALTLSILAGRMDIVQKIMSTKIPVDDRDGAIYRHVDINRDINAVSAGISRGYLGYFLSVGLSVKKFFPYIMFLLTENVLSEEVTGRSIDLLSQSSLELDYGKSKRSDHYFSLALLNTIHQQKVTLTESLIRRGFKLNVSVVYSDHQWFDISPLVMAVISGNMEMVRMLVESGADIDEYDKDGRTALMIAEEMKHRGIIHFLKCPPDQPKTRASPTHKREIAKALVYRKTSDPDEIFFLLGQKRNKKQYELFSLDSSSEAWEEKSSEELSIKAVSRGALIDLLPHIASGSIRKKLFDRYDFGTNLVIETHGFLVDSTSKLKPYRSDEYREARWISASDISTRHYLISNYDRPMIESVIRNSPFIDHTYIHSVFKLNAQLFAAIRKDSCATVEELLAAGADANSLNDKNITPLAVACDTPCPNLRLIQTLIQNGALVNYACCYEAVACDTPRPNLKLIRTLIQNGEPFNNTYFYEMGELVPLQLALLHRSKALVSLLCENGADPNQKLGKNTTPLITACGMGDIESIEILISYGADFKTNENKGILAGLCAVPCADNLFDYLIDRADIDGLSAHCQCTPLMACVKLGDTNRIIKLLAKGADPDIRHPRTFKSASDFALEKNMWHIVDILCVTNDVSKQRMSKVNDTERVDYTDERDCAEWWKSQAKIFRILADTSSLHANVFNEIADFEEAFKAFYDKNINHLKLFSDGESDKISNLDNEAVHILLDKFSDVAQNGTKEEKKRVKSFFLNSTDFRDLSHLQGRGDSLLTLPYHTPYVQFVMDQEYRGKGFKLFCLSDVLQFYHSGRVSFRREAPVRTWLKVVQEEIAPFDRSQDKVIATITLLDNCSGDKRVIEQIFKQYIDAIDPLPVLSVKTSTFVRLVLIFFNSFGSGSLKKCLLDKLNWNQFTEMTLGDSLAIEDRISLYRIHDATLKFPSVAQQKLLGDSCLSKIRDVSFANYKITLLEQLMFTKNGYFSSPIVDDVFRNEIITLWIEIILMKYGLDDGTHSYSHTMKKVIDSIDSEVCARDRSHLFQELANSLETQTCLSAYIGDIISPTDSKHSIREKSATVLGTALKMISQTETDKIRTLDFLSMPLTAESLDSIVEHAASLHCREGIEELVEKLSGREDDHPYRYDENDVKEVLMMTYHQFWNLNLEERASVINTLLIPSEIDSASKYKKDAKDPVFLYAVQKLFPNAQSAEQDTFSRAFLIAYLRTVNECERRYLLEGMTASNAAGSESKALVPGRLFTQLCKNLGPADVKLARSHPKTLENMRCYLEPIASLQYCWDLWRLLDGALTRHHIGNIPRLGSLLGSASAKFVMELKNYDERWAVLISLQDDTKTEGSDDSTHFSIADNVCDREPHREAISNRIAQAQEGNIRRDCGDKLYLGVKKPDQIQKTFYQSRFDMATTLSRGKGYRFLGSIRGKELNDLSNITNKYEIACEDIAMAMVETELESIRAGHSFDCDPRGNHSSDELLKNNNIRFQLFDFGETSTKKTGRIQLRQFADDLLSLSHSSSYPRRIQCNDLLDIDAIQSAKHTNEPIAYLMRIRETLCDTQVLDKELIDSELVGQLNSIHSYDVPLLRADIHYFSNKTNFIQYQPTKHSRSFSQSNYPTNFMPFVPHHAFKVRPNDGMNSSKTNTMQNKQIFITIASENRISKQRDYYADILVNSLKEQYQDKIVFIPAFKDETFLYQQIGLSTQIGAQPVLHVVINVPDISFTLTPERLQTFKDKGGYVVVTVIGFVKHLGPDNFNIKSDAITILEKADYAIFLDENDQKCAIEFAVKMRKKIPPSQVVAVPTTVFPKKRLAERGKDILSFGAIRAGKGFAHIIKLAKLMKESEDRSVRGKRIIVVGTVGQDQDKWDRTLKNLMVKVYPDQEEAMDMIKPYQLMALLKETQSDLGIKPSLPIEFHLNVSEHELSELLDRCTYSYLPVYRGATLRDSSILSSLINQFVTFVHEGKNTPGYLKEGGLYQDAVSMIQHDAETEFYSYSAETVLADVIRREGDPALNIKTAQTASRLINEQLSSIIASQHDEVYCKAIFLKANYPFFHLPDEKSLTIPRPEEGYPSPKRYVGFNRLSQTLRHVSSVIYRTMKKEFKCNPKEVQVAMLVDQLHISSNFYSDRLASALSIIMTQDQFTEKKRVAECDWKKARFDRELRHLISLKRFLSSDPIFDTTIDKGVAEIKQGLGTPQHSNLSPEEITGQFIVQMKSLRSVLQHCTSGNNHGVIVHSTPTEDEAVTSALFENGVTATRHAERNIVQYLADHAEWIYAKSLDCFSLRAGKHVLVPLEGRFVPCGFCCEQEAVDRMPDGGGLFDPVQGRFLLHRSGLRAGNFFVREIQFFTSSSFHPDPVEARNRSLQILEDIANSSPHLHTYGRPIVANTFFNTDSEESNEDPL